MKELKDTFKGMTSENYKERFIAEYQQVCIRYSKLKDFLKKIDLATEYKVGKEPKHDCPVKLLQDQLSAMGNYIYTLELRAVIEKIDLEG